jgi:hypothetical protein
MLYVKFAVLIVVGEGTRVPYHEEEVLTASHLAVFNIHTSPHFLLHTFW